MKQLIALLSLAFASTLSQALTLEPLPGSSPQATCISCVFPNPVGVIARGTSGEPVAGVAVTFAQSGEGPVALIDYHEFCCQAQSSVTVMTNANGVAIGTAVALEYPNASGSVIASAAGANNVAFSLSSTGQHASAIQVVSGDNQYVLAGEAVPAPWKVRVLDEAGNPMARAMVTYYAGSNGGASASFNGGDDWAFAVADANGYANSPTAIAGGVTGLGVVYVAMKNSYQGVVIWANAISFHVLPASAHTITLEPLPGSSPQATCISCVFPKPIGVIARGSSGQPVADVAVTFSVSGEGPLGLVDFDDFCCQAQGTITVTTDANGVATATALALEYPNATGIIRALAPDSNIVELALSSTGQHVSAIEIVGGNDQYVEAGKLFAAPWKVRVLDQSGAPMARAILTAYSGDYGSGLPSATVNGAEWVNLIADASGVATAPLARAGSVVGDSAVDIGTKNSYLGTFVFSPPLRFHVVPGPITSARATLVSKPVDSLALYLQTEAPYVVKVLDSRGRPARDMPVVFSAYECGTFEGEVRQAVMTDAKGLATSPRFVSQETGMCRIEITVPGTSVVLQSTMHVYDPSTVVVTARNPLILARTRQPYRVHLQFKADGLPIQISGFLSANVVNNYGGPPAGITSYKVVSVAKGSAVLEAKANSVAGIYDLEIVHYGPSLTRVKVLQTR